MSSLTVIKIDAGLFFNKTCLEQALLEYGNTELTIIEKNQSYQIQLEGRFDLDFVSLNKIRPALRRRMENVVQDVHAIYTKHLTKHFLESQGFNITEEKNTQSNSVFVFSRTKAISHNPNINSGDGGDFDSSVGLDKDSNEERIIVHSIKQQNEVHLEGEGFQGEDCLSYMNPIEQQLGRVIRRTMKTVSRSQRMKISSQRETTVSEEKRLRVRRG